MIQRISCVSEHRHRHPPRDDRRDSPLHGREPVQVRSARLSEARDGRREGRLQGTLPAVRLRGMASKIKPVPPERIAAKYKSGELKQIVNEFLIVGPYDALPLGARPGLISL